MNQFSRNLHALFQREQPHIILAARGTVAALAAMTVAIILKLEYPYWAAMTALIVIQPTRGQLLEKSFYRLVGTAIGSGAGMLMLLSSRSPATLTILLALWLAGCVGVGNLLYGLRSYGALVAAFTGVVIAMAGYNNPPDLHDLVFGRIACITIGIITSTTVTMFFTRHRSKREFIDRLIRAAVTEIEWIARLVQGAEEKNLAAQRQDILVEIAEIEGSIDATWAGSLDIKQKKRHVKHLIVVLLSFLGTGKLAGAELARCCCGQDLWQDTLARQLFQIANDLSHQKSTGWHEPEQRNSFAEIRARFPALAEALSELIEALQHATTNWSDAPPDTGRAATYPLIRHRDWQEARRAALRAAAAISAVGMVWYFTGRPEGTLMLMAASIMVSIFSTHDRPAVMLNYIFCGATIGVAAAFLCRLVLLPGVSEPFQQEVLSIPFLMIGIIALSHRRTSHGAMDFLMFFLFVMQPGTPAVPTPAAFVMGGCAALGGIGVAILVFRFLLPIDPSRRLRSIQRTIIRDLSVMAMSTSLPLVKKHQARMHHRVLRMITYATKLDENSNDVVEGAFAALTIGRFMLQSKETGTHAKNCNDWPETIRNANARLCSAIQHPEESLTVLQDVLHMLCGTREACVPVYDESMCDTSAEFVPHLPYMGGRKCHI